MHAYTEKGRERILDKDAFIVSKTDLKGHITYANRIFLDIADYSESEVLGKPHSILRHPLMPKTLFKIVWEHLHENKEVFAIIINRTKDDCFYWVAANLTPDFNLEGKKVGYFSIRRQPTQKAIKTMSHLYKQILEVEQAQPNDHLAIEAGKVFLNQYLEQQGVSYEEFIIALQGE